MRYVNKKLNDNSPGSNFSSLKSWRKKQKENMERRLKNQMFPSPNNPEPTFEKQKGPLGLEVKNKIHKNIENNYRVF